MRLEPAQWALSVAAWSLAMRARPLLPLSPATRAHVNRQPVMGAHLGVKYTDENTTQKSFQVEELWAHAGTPTGQVALQFTPTGRGGI